MESFHVNMRWVWAVSTSSMNLQMSKWDRNEKFLQTKSTKWQISRSRVKSSMEVWIWNNPTGSYFDSGRLWKPQEGSSWQRQFTRAGLSRLQILVCSPFSTSWPTTMGTTTASCSHCHGLCRSAMLPHYENWNCTEAKINLTLLPVRGFRSSGTIHAVSMSTP